MVERLGRCVLCMQPCSSDPCHSPYRAQKLSLIKNGVSLYCLVCPALLCTLVGSTSSWLIRFVFCFFFVERPFFFYRLCVCYAWTVGKEKSTREKQIKRERKKKSNKKKEESGSIVVQSLVYFKQNENEIYTKLVLTIRIYQANLLVCTGGGPNGHLCLDAVNVAPMTSQQHWLLFDWCDWTCGFWLPLAKRHRLGLQRQPGVGWWKWWQRADEKQKSATGSTE